jgi:hypothetical protein
MANTFELINSITLTSATNFASVSFTSIPQTYKDITIWANARSNRLTLDGLERVYLYMNGSSSGIRMINTVVANASTYSDIYDTGSGVGGTCGLCSNAYTTGGNFGFSMLYISDYATTNPKIGIVSSSMPITGIPSNQNEYAFGQSYHHGTTSGVTSITTSGLGSQWESGSTFYLYGIK